MMLKKKEKLIFTLFLFSCIFLSMSFVCAHDNVSDVALHDGVCDDSMVVDNKNGSSNYLGNKTGNDLNSSDNISNNNYTIYFKLPTEPIVLVLNYNGSNVKLSNSSKVINGGVKKVPLKFIAKNKVFNKKVKIKKYSVVLKNNKGNAIKNTWITLKISGKLFKAKTNSKGKATFKIVKLNRMGKYTATLKFNGNRNYNAVNKKVKIIFK